MAGHQSTRIMTHANFHFNKARQTSGERKEPGTVNRAGKGRTLSIVPVSQISNGRLSEGNEGGD